MSEHAAQTIPCPSCGLSMGRYVDPAGHDACSTCGWDSAGLEFPAPPDCACSHPAHLHDWESVPGLCMSCGDAERCDTGDKAVSARVDELMMLAVHGHLDDLRDALTALVCMCGHPDCADGEYGAAQEPPC